MARTSKATVTSTKTKKPNYSKANGKVAQYAVFELRIEPKKFAKLMGKKFDPSQLKDRVVLLESSFGRIEYNPLYVKNTAAPEPKRTWKDWVKDYVFAHAKCVILTEEEKRAEEERKNPKPFLHVLVYNTKEALEAFFKWLSAFWKKFDVPTKLKNGLYRLRSFTTSVTKLAMEKIGFRKKKNSQEFVFVGV